MEVRTTNNFGDVKEFENVLDIDRSESGDLLIHIQIGESATKWEKVIDGKVERVK